MVFKSQIQRKYSCLQLILIGAIVDCFGLMGFSWALADYGIIIQLDLLFLVWLIECFILLIGKRDNLKNMKKGKRILSLSISVSTALAPFYFVFIEPWFFECLIFYIVPWSMNVVYILYCTNA